MNDVGGGGRGSAWVEASEIAQWGGLTVGRRQQRLAGPAIRALPLRLPPLYRDNLFAPVAGGRAPFLPGGLGQEAPQRVIHVDLALAEAPEAGGAAAAAAGPAAAAAAAGGLAAAGPAGRAAGAPRRASWRQRGAGPLAPPAPVVGLGAAGAKAPAGLPLLPSGPTPVSPMPLQRQAPLCPVPAPRRGAAGAERCLPDAGAFQGASFRVGWAPDARLAFAGE